jgi:hypothetical protein
MASISSPAGSRQRPELTASPSELGGSKNSSIMLSPSAATRTGHAHTHHMEQKVVQHNAEKGTLRAVDEKDFLKFTADKKRIQVTDEVITQITIREQGDSSSGV